MKRFRLRFSLKMMLVAVAFVAVGSYVLVLPTVRARQFAKLINSKQLEYAAAMLPAYMNDSSLHRQTLGRAIGAEIMPLTLNQLCHGERSVVVTGNLGQSEGEWDGIKLPQSLIPGGGDTAEFIVWRSTVSAGFHGFLQW